MNPIETVYKGYRFRSRLEARWAVFFGTLGIKWEYEVEGYKLPSGYYLPDFWLPVFENGMYVEVKPDIKSFLPTQAKVQDLCIESQKPVWICDGVPEAKEYLCFYPTGQKEVPLDLRFGIPLFDQAEFEDRMFIDSGLQAEELWNLVSKNYQDAVYKARQVRFEHGEQG